MRPNDVHLTIALNDYDHVRDLFDGGVEVEGVALTCLRLGAEETFFRFARYREWDISEFSMGKYCSLRASGDQSLSAIPAFPSRAFRHSALFIRADGPLDAPEQLSGARIGIPEWTQTATIYARGILEHQYGVALSKVRWFQAGTNEAGRVEGIPLAAPPGFSITPVPDRTLNEMLLSGDLDAVIAAHPPLDFKQRTGRVIRLFSDPRAVEEAYYAETGVFPIMHVIAIRSDVLDRHPWVAMNLLSALRECRRRSVDRALDENVPRYPIPWSPANARRACEIFGGDMWPYGVNENRRTLETFLGFAHEQGVCSRLLEPESLFAESVLEDFRI